ncbi:MAG: transglutaminase N-terminal domain-containing protein [Tepidisphaerales bacterium]
MLYRIRHTTEYRYGDAASLSQNQARLRPRDTSWQKCVGYELQVDPRPSSRSERVDYFGNHVTDFFIQTPHSVFAVTSEALIEVNSPPPPPQCTTPWEQAAAELRSPRNRDALEASQYTFGSSAAPERGELRDWAMEVFLPGRAIVEGAMALMSRIHREFKYDKSATAVNTPVMEAFAMRRGVCQDFAHLMIACLRSLGLSARYVSGYLRTRPPPGTPRLVGADASHAWISVFVPPETWVDLDPTNNQPAVESYITTAWGRDYHDVAPLRGVFLGGGSHALRVSVDVEPVGEPAF